ncbi:MAG TPA: hypothetical protein VK874_08490 [Gaiellaceae bacterium]|nr:hypothetical protein [Gaiellaceae bacterium]
MSGMAGHDTSRPERDGCDAGEHGKGDQDERRAEAPVRGCGIGRADGGRARAGLRPGRRVHRDHSGASGDGHSQVSPVRPACAWTATLVVGHTDLGGGGRARSAGRGAASRVGHRTGIRAGERPPPG